MPQAGEPINLGKGAKRHNLCTLALLASQAYRIQLEGGIGKIPVGLVQHHQGGVGQGPAELEQGGFWEKVSGRIVEVVQGLLLLPAILLASRARPPSLLRVY